jgi:hypothetical protein
LNKQENEVECIKLSYNKHVLFVNKKFKILVR